MSSLRARALTVLTALAATALASTPALAAPGAVSVGNADLTACTTTSVLCLSTLASNDTPTAGSGAVVDDPRAASGKGYLRLSTPGASDKATVYHPTPGMTLGQLTTLAYQTYIENPGTNEPRQAPSFNIAVKTPPFGPTNRTFTTLVWEPVYRTGATVTPGTWQAWSPSAGDGWWATGTTQVTGQENELGFDTYTATFAEVVAAVGATATVQSIAVNQGSGSPGLRAGVDLLRVNDTVFDFENPVAATAITPTAGNNQSAAAGTPFATPLAAKVTGGTRPVTGTPVVFRVTGGSATFPGNAPTASATTDGNGVATAPVLTAGTTPGPVTITATAGSGAATGSMAEAVVTTTFSATVTAPPPAAVSDLAVTVSAPATGRPGNSFVATVRVTNKGTAPVARATTVVTLDGGLLVVSAPDAVRPAVGKTLTILDGPLAPGATATHRVTVVGTKAGATVVTAVTTAAGTDATPADNIARAAVRLG